MYRVSPPKNIFNLMAPALELGCLAGWSRLLCWQYSWSPGLGDGGYGITSIRTDIRCASPAATTSAPLPNDARNAGQFPPSHKHSKEPTTPFPPNLPSPAQLLYSPIRNNLRNWRSYMSVKLRLKRMGRSNRAFFRLNAIDSRSPRDGRVIEELGFTIRAPRTRPSSSWPSWIGASIGWMSARCRRRRFRRC